MATAAAAGLLASQAYLEGRSVRETRSVVSDRCRQFYRLCWVTGTGTGGSITIKAHDDAVPKAQQLRVMSPSGVQAERMVSENMYVLSSGGQVLSAPSPKPQPQKPPKCTDCAPLFMKAYQMRNAGAVTFLKRGKDDYMFSGHPLCNKVKIENIQICVEISTELWILPKIQEHELSKIPLFKKKGWTRVWYCNYHPLEKEFKITHMDMIKGIQGHGYHDELVVPMMENTTHERELTESLSEAMAAYPKAIDVLVRNYGIYVWGNSWINVKTQAECYHYLSDAALKLHQLGVEPSPCNHGPIGSAKPFRNKDSLLSASIRAEAKNGNHVLEPSRQCIVLDIEGTTTPISFVADVLFPYARDNVRKHLISTYDTTETKEDIELLRLQVEDDLKQGISGAVPIPSDDAGKKAVIDSLVSNVEAMIIADRKITSLKQLQGHIWRTGFANKELQGIVYEDVPEALKRWHANGVKVYIYSSGSREAQRLIFGNTTYGDLRKYLCGYFDTAVGNKRESHSYFEIFQSVGVDKPSQILFLTDVYQEAVAAKAAGLEVLISVRPGNVPLPDNHGFQTITSFAEI